MKRKKLWFRLLIAFIIVPVVLFFSVLAIIYAKQDSIIQSQVAALNEQLQGQITVQDSHLEPFADFPYISLKVDSVTILESKSAASEKIVEVEDIYVGFQFWDLIQGNIDIQTLLIEEGRFSLVIHKDGTSNLENAFKTNSETEESPSELLAIHLKKIEVKNLDIHQLDETSMMDVETFIKHAVGGFKSDEQMIAAHIDTDFEMNVINDGDTTYFNHKEFEIHTDVEFIKASGLLTFAPSGIRMEHGDFRLTGIVDTKNDMTLDLVLNGSKPNFDMFIAFAPHDLIPVLERYRNAGKVYFSALLKGPTLKGHLPFIDAQFGASEAYLENIEKEKRIDHMGFNGHFTNGEKHDLSTMEFSLENMSAQLDKGNFNGSIRVKNFETPEIDMQLDADFDLKFLFEFLNLESIRNPAGSIAVHMRFADIIDLNNPEEALQNFNHAYFAELQIDHLSFESDALLQPLKRMDVHLKMEGKEAILDKFFVEMGNSDLALTASLSDLPAIIHQTATPVEAHAKLHSNNLNFAELTGYSVEDSSGINEEVNNLEVAVSFRALANAFTQESPLPVGEFFIDKLYAELKHYPHALHDFHADILIEENRLAIKDFSGFIDQSDFNLSGSVNDYNFWMEPALNGDTELDLALSSKRLRLEDLFSYNGENYVPEDYRHESLENLELHLNTFMHYKNSELHSIDLNLDDFSAKMNVHPLAFKKFNGKFHYEDDHIQVREFKAALGLTSVNINANYYLGDNPELRLRDNYFTLQSDYINFDELHQFEMESPKEKTTEIKTTADVQEHMDAFNIYELPFTDMRFETKVGHFIYHRIDLQNIEANLRTTANHYLYIDTLHMQAAGGEIAVSGYFNGSDSDHIYFKPQLKMTNVDIDQLMFKFENFGQDALVSDNLHGKLSASITGNVRMYPDMVPDLDQSELHMDIQVLNGRLENYQYMEMLSDYMGDKDLSSVRFDTLQNHMDISNGTLNVPNMTIESTLGHFDVSGTQDMYENMEYYVRIPWSVVKAGARNKILGPKKPDEDPNSEDEIVELDPNKKVKYVNLKIKSTKDDFKITVGKDKKESNAK